MYNTHQWRVEHFASQREGNTVDVLIMVLLSIRMQWSGVGTQMESWREHGLNSEFLWGFKRKGALYIHENRKRLFQRANCARNGHIWVEDLMRELLKVPGLGMVKAGFACQLLIGEVGCLDVHNINRLGLKSSEWYVRTYKDIDKQLREVDEKIETYMNLIDECGGTRILWNDWCEHLASNSKAYENADDVSLRHVTYLTGETS